MANRTRTVLRLAIENVNGLVFLGGAAWCYIGIAGFSPQAANIVAGAAVMAIAAWPYLPRTNRKP